MACPCCVLGAPNHLHAFELTKHTMDVCVCVAGGGGGGIDPVLLSMIADAASMSGLLNLGSCMRVCVLMRADVCEDVGV